MDSPSRTAGATCRGDECSLASAGFEPRGRERPILFSAAMVRALLAGTKTQTRRVVTPANSSVLGERVAANSPTWRGLKLEHPTTRARSQSTMMQAICGADAPHDPHLDVPWIHPDDEAAGHVWEADPIRYRVRPMWEAGDTLWVREAWATWMHAPILPGTMGGGLSRDPGDWLYRATDPEWEAMLHDRKALAIHARQKEDGKTGNYVVRNSIHMPRWASRITLRITDVRVERLNEISETDAIAEGAACLATDGEGAFYEDAQRGTYRMGYAGLWEHINGRGSWEANPWVWALRFERITPPAAPAPQSPEGLPAMIARDEP